MQFKLIMINLFIFLSALCLPLAVASAEVVQVEGVTIWADALSYDKESDTYRATGNVMIVWNETVLIADNATLSDAGNEAVAEGRVRLVKGSEVLHGDRIMLHMHTDTWEVTNGNLLSRTSNFHIKGQKIEKVGEDKYRLDRGSFTTCDGEHPSWKFTSSNMDVTLEDICDREERHILYQGYPAVVYAVHAFSGQSRTSNRFFDTHPLAIPPKRGPTLISPFTGPFLPVRN